MAHDLVESEHSRRGHSKISALMVTDYGYPAGGAEVFVQALKLGLKARGHTVRVFASNAGAKDKKVKEGEAEAAPTEGEATGDATTAGTS